MVFKPKIGDIEVSPEIKESGNIAKTIDRAIRASIREYNKVNDFDKLKDQVKRDVIKNGLGGNKQDKKKVYVYVVGDDKNNAFIDIFIAPFFKPKRSKKTNEESYSVTVEREIKKLWRTYNDEFSNIVKKGRISEPDFSKGYDWYSGDKIEKVQDSIVPYVKENFTEIVKISRYHSKAEVRGIANFFLRYLTNKQGIKILLSATKDSDHFAHNMAWQSLLVKVRSQVLTSKQKKEIIFEGYDLLNHPSTICRDKGLNIIQEALEIFGKKIIPSPVLKRVGELSVSKNPWIAGYSKEILSLYK